MSTEDKYDPEKKMPRREDPLAVIAELLKDHGIHCSAFLSIDWEGDTLPGGTPNESGTILVEDGRVFDYWLGWDPDKTAPDGTKGWYDLGENRFFEYEGEKFAYFREVLPSEQDEYPKPDNSSFIAAKKELGLE